MTDLSPQAQAILDAFGNTSNGEYIEGVWIVNEHAMLAAALRAAADQVVPATECYKARHDNCCERSVKQERSDIRILLRDIAFELEAQ